MARAIEQLKQAMEACELGALTLPDQIDSLMDAGKAILQEVSTLTPPNEPLTQADIDKMHFDRVWIDYGVDDSGERCGEEGVVLYGKLYDIDTLEGAGLEEMLLDTGAGETLDRPSGDYKVYRRPPGEAE